MKHSITNYAFSASAKTVTFTDLTTVVLEKILMVVNVTDGIILYDFSDPTKLGTVATNVLTLAYNTGTMSDSDKLMIFYQEGDYPLMVAGNVSITSTANILIPATDCLEFSHVTFHLLTIGGGTPSFLFEGTNDPTLTLWQTITLQGAASTNAVSVATAVNTIFAGGIPTRWFRVRVSVVGTGSATAVALFRAQSIPTIPVSTLTANQGGTWNIGTVTPGGAAANLGKAEDAAHTSGDTGVMALGVRYEGLTAPNVANDYGFFATDDLGKQVTMPYAPLVNQVQFSSAAITTTTVTEAFPAVASVRNYVTSITLLNTGAAATAVEVREGTNVIWRGYVGINGYVNCSFPTPLKGAAGAAINVVLVSGTTVNVYATLTGFKAL